MSRDLAVVLFSAVLATLNPSLLAATTMMLLLPNPKRLMLRLSPRGVHVEHRQRSDHRLLGARLESREEHE